MSFVILLVAPAATVLVVGCSTVPESPYPAPSLQDPIIGVWATNQSRSPTFYRFYENGTFQAWSHTGDIHPKYSFQYSGKWEASGLFTYTTEGLYIGYGSVTPLDIYWIYQGL
jgi:hypothetical protein